MTLVRTCSTTLALLLLGALPLWSGCSKRLSCEELCTRNNACAGAMAQDCTAFCTEVTAFNAATSCAGKFDSFLDCGTANVDQLCSSTSPCAAETSAYMKCVTDFCLANQTSGICK